MDERVKPKGSTWTDEQWRAVVDGGQDVLVAAAAGSGKTAVLVERIMRMISDEHQPVHVVQLLIATFTKAAASEMRERIRLAMERQLKDKPHSKHLRRQLALLNRASIMTLHSFCLEVIQRHFQSVSLDPAFRIAHDAEIELLRQDVLERLFEERYADGQPEFKRMIDWFSGERDDAAAFRLVQQLYDFSRSHPWPDEWIQQMAASFQVDSVQQLGQSTWVDSVLQEARLTLKEIVELLRQAYRLLEVPGGPQSYRVTLMQELSGAIALVEAIERERWEHLYSSFHLLAFGRLPACRGNQYDKSLQEQVKKLREQAKNRWVRLQEQFFQRTPAQFLQELRTISPLLFTLVSVVQQFGLRFTEAKRKQGWLDFSDLEHYCLRILRHPDSTPSHTIPSEVAKQYAQQYVEIFLDEYQDTNRVQEAIVNLIMQPGTGNRFMVGDVKQSIYRFRLADPDLFLHKYGSYSIDSENRQGVRIDLTRNFRSRQEIVDAVNMLFRQIMNERVVELKYDRAAELVYGAAYPSSEEIGQELHVGRRKSDVVSRDLDRKQLVERQNYTTELVLIDKCSKGGNNEDANEAEDSDNERDSLSNIVLNPVEMEMARLEARAIAARICRLLGGEEGASFLLFDKTLKRMRPIIYRDIVILLRATQGWAPLIIEELGQRGIPAYAECKVGYFQSTEVEVMLSLLRIIDNPQQDIPLAAVLRSPIVGLTAEELAKIRLKGKDGSFYDAVCKAVEHNADKKTGSAGEGLAMACMVTHIEETELGAAVPDVAELDATERNWRGKLYRFLCKLEHWRTAARQGRLPQLIWQLYRETGYYEWVGGLARGMQHQANLRALYDRACQYESSSIRGLFRFLRFIERMRNMGGDLGTARALGEQEDVVRIMTIHKSKGLEFPVVFVAGLSKIFNQQDLHSPLLMHKQLGFGPKYVDEEQRVTYPTLPNLAIRRQMRLELLAEEMRVLYVALTRPQQKMILVATVNDAEKAIQVWGEALDVESLLLPDYMLARARAYMDWIGPALIRHAASSAWRKYAELPDQNGECLMGDPSQWHLSIIPATVLASDSLCSISKLDEDKAVVLEALGRLEEKPNMPSSKWKEQLTQLLCWRDPNQLATLLPAKTSVTEMKRMVSFDEWPTNQWVPELAASMQTGRAEPTAATSMQVDHGCEEATQSVDFAAGEEGFTLHLRRPKFMEASQVTPVECGVVYHLLMQHISLHADVCAASITDTLRNLVEHQFVSSKQVEMIDQQAVAAFFNCGVGRQLLEATWVKRELPFSYRLTATEAYSVNVMHQLDDLDYGRAGVLHSAGAGGSTDKTSGKKLDFVGSMHLLEEEAKASLKRFIATSTFAACDTSSLLEKETVLVQGVIDCIFEWHGQLILLDYKTDKVREQCGGLKAWIEHYRFQIDLYARAIEQIWQRPVNRKVLYFFDARTVCEL